MNLVFAIKSLEVSGGGAERVLVDVANGLVSRGHRVAVVTFDRAGAPSFYSLDDRVARTGVDISPPGIPTPRLRLPAGLWRLRRETLQRRPDLVIGFMHSTYVPLAFAMMGSGAKMVASEHVGMSHFHGRPLQKFLVKAVDRSFVAKTVPSGLVRDEIVAGGGREAHVLPNPLSIAALSNARTSQDRRPVLLCVGRFMQEKDHHSLLRAFAQIAGDFPHWRLRLVGDGELRPLLETRVAELGLSRRVEMPGVIADVASEYRKAAIVVVPSFYESFGLVVVESLASGCPVVGFEECLGPLKIASHGHNALLVRGGDDRAGRLAEGLKQLMASPELRARLGAAGPAAVQGFDRESVVSQWEEFLQDCIAT